ncbi:MAG: hypothetical protein OXG24_10345 [Gammaproteobacteria bacterium]|nr:hypothetical protein [Gammaproteobacteria bacterium]
MTSLRTSSNLHSFQIARLPLAVCIFCLILFGPIAANEQAEGQDGDDSNFPWISTLDSGNWQEKLWGDRELRRNGSRLLKLEKGLHFLEQTLSPQNDVLIAIHGFGAHGYEWVYPLLTLDNEKLDTYFFRWAWGRPTERAEKLFLNEFKEMHSSRGESLKKVHVVAHSCGGTVIMSVLESLPKDMNFEVHVVASPLGGLGIFTVCDVDLPKEIPANIEVTQWKTQQHLDSVYLYFPWDTQDAGLDGIEVIDLPERIKGKRIGHVRALSWVADQIANPNTAENDESTPSSGASQ